MKFDKNITFPEMETIICKFWRKTDAFERSKVLSKGREEFVFYDGPPFATGLPHYGHILSGTIKDIIGRFMYQQGFSINRRFGWDCHGLPIEYEIDKQLGIRERKQILEMGIDKYNEACRSIVMKYSNEWQHIVERMGRWVDFENGYKTMDLSFMESTWFVFKELWKRDYIYRGYKVMAFSTGCKTPVSNFEANQNYRDVSDPSVLIAFKLRNSIDDRETELVAWTTTPWTLPANCALVLNPNIKYVILAHLDRHLVVCASRAKEYFPDAQVVRELAGSDLVGLEYEPLFDYYAELRDRGYFRVLKGNFVSDTNGTGIVHTAPGFGEDDYLVCVENNLITENEEVPCPVDENGNYTIGAYKGMYVKDMDRVILKDLGKRVLMNAREVHSYPFCWRSDTPLLYKLSPNWFVRVRNHRDQLVANNREITWVPETIKYGRFCNWLSQARDWAVGRNRFWGTPVPVWVANDGDMLCIGSVQELEELSGVRVTDLHREHVDGIVIVKDGKEFRRCEEVLDCWFESGSMPYAQDHWPFSVKNGNEDSNRDNADDSGVSAHPFLKKKGLPADFIGEGLDQTRGWFYTLHVLSSLLFGKPAFKNVICFGIVLAEDGKKMSKRLKNYPDPTVIFDTHGADALRLYLINSPVVLAENLRFSENGVKDILKTIMLPWKNVLGFYIECTGTDVVTTYMDDWILSSLDNLCYKVTQACNAYALNGLVSHIAAFIDDLSNWYVRINRNNLREASGFLGQILIRFSIIMAPFAPFFSEYCYQVVKSKSGSLIDSLNSLTINNVCPENQAVNDDNQAVNDNERTSSKSSAAADSVHFNMFPRISRERHVKFEDVKAVIELIRQMRESKSLSLKRPLKYVEVVAPECFREAIASAVNLIKHECNILELKLVDIFNYKYSHVVKPCYAVLRRDMSTMKEKLAAIKHITEDDVICLLAKDCLSVDVLGIKVYLDDLIVEREFKDVSNSRISNNFGVILDLSVDEKIVDMKVAREFYAFLQKLRKSSGLKIGDSVGVYCDNTYLHKLLSVYYSNVKFEKSDDLIVQAKYFFDNENIVVSLYRLDL